MSNEEKSRQDEFEQSEAEYFEFIEICVEEGWSPTRCPEGCIVELDGACPHNFKSFLLEYGFI